MFVSDNMDTNSEILVNPETEPLATETQRIQIESIKPSMRSVSLQRVLSARLDLPIGKLGKPFRNFGIGPWYNGYDMELTK
jgi:hypothetical protein